MKFMIKKFLRWVAGIPQPTIDFPPYHQNRPYVEGLSWSICKVVDDGFKWVDVFGKVGIEMDKNPGELSPFLRGAWNGLYLLQHGRCNRNIEPIPENRAMAPFRFKSGGSFVLNRATNGKANQTESEEA